MPSPAADGFYVSDFGESADPAETVADFYSYLYELTWLARIDKDPIAQGELERFREAGEPEVRRMDEERREFQRAYDQRDAMREAEARRALRHRPAALSVHRPTGRAARPACNARTRGSRRTTASARAGPDDPDLADPAVTLSLRGVAA